tara:strand:+ start:141 stop:746 length:606 start_codon:yes stop_codon:yes gene_type:complete
MTGKPVTPSHMMISRKQWVDVENKDADDLEFIKSRTLSPMAQTPETSNDFLISDELLADLENEAIEEKRAKEYIDIFGKKSYDDSVSSWKVVNTEAREQALTILEAREQARNILHDAGLDEGDAASQEVVMDLLMASPITEQAPSVPHWQPHLDSIYPAAKINPYKLSIGDKKKLDNIFKSSSKTAEEYGVGLINNNVIKQ